MPSKYVPFEDKRMLTSRETFMRRYVPFADKRMLTSREIFFMHRNDLTWWNSEVPLRAKLEFVGFKYPQRMAEWETQDGVKFNMFLCDLEELIHRFGVAGQRAIDGKWEFISRSGNWGIRFVE